MTAGLHGRPYEKLVTSHETFDSLTKRATIRGHLDELCGRSSRDGVKESRAHRLEKPKTIQRGFCYTIAPFLHEMQKSESSCGTDRPNLVHREGREKLHPPSLAPHQGNAFAGRYSRPSLPHSAACTTNPQDWQRRGQAFAALALDAPIRMIFRQ